MSAITTHVLDLTSGRPAAGVEVTLDRLDDDGRWAPLGRGATDHDGRLGDLLPAVPSSPAAKGTYRLSFATGAYFARSATPAFHPHVEVAFTITDPDRHHHVPLLLSPFGYSTYRGS